MGHLKEQAIEQKKMKERGEALRNGAYCLTQELYESLKRGDVVVFADKGGKENHTSVMLAGNIREEARK